jgi:putative peptidoglycan lipid II flippase
VLSVGTTLGVVALSLPLLVPAWRAGVRLRPTWTFPPGVARRAAALAGAGVLALVAQQVAVLVAVWVTNNRGGTGAINVFNYVQAVYLLPYAVLAVPIAMSAFPALAAGGAHAAREDAAQASARATLSRSTRAVAVVGFAGAAVLIVTAGPIGAFFGFLDQGRGTPAGQAALSAMPAAMTAYAPGLVGFGLAALLTRALYVRGHPAVPAVAVCLGWVIAALWPLLALSGVPGPGDTLRALGAAWSVGMSVTAVVLLVAMRGAWGRGALAGLGRTLLACVGAAAAASVAGRLVADRLPTGAIATTVLTGVVAAALAMAVFVAVLAVADPEDARALYARLTRSRSGSSTEAAA